MSRCGEGCETARAQACVDLARNIYKTGAEDSSKEARGWCSLAIAFDKAAADGTLRDLQEKAKRKGRTRENAAKMKAIAGGKVVAMRGGDPI